jgi:hypothetical protein
MNSRRVLIQTELTAPTDGAHDPYIGHRLRLPALLPAAEQRSDLAPSDHSISSSARAIDCYLLSAEMNVFPDGPTPVIWMITSPSLAHV